MKNGAEQKPGAVHPFPPERKFMSYESHTSTGNQAGNTPISNALEIAIKQNVVNIYRELSPVVVGVKDFVSKEDSQKRLRAAELCRHEILSHLYAGDQSNASGAFRTFLALGENLETEATRAEPFNLEAVTEACLHGAAVKAATERAEVQRVAIEKVAIKPLIEFLSPSEIKKYEPPPGTLLVGDNHIVRGGVFIIGGPPGVGKSRSTGALAEAGATRLDWFGLPVHTTFKTLIVQNENGRFRLKLEFAELNANLLDEHLRISPPPPYGLRFDKVEFRDQVREYVERFNPGVIQIDPWNAVSRDDKARDYRESFDLIRDVVPASDEAPSIGIIAHTRKPLPNERANGRTLLNLLAGSHILASVPRTIWILQHATDDVAETRVVVTCCKNNDGALGPRTVWIRENGLWTQVHDFDWQEWDHPDPNKKKDSAINENSMSCVFDNGGKALKLVEARDALMALTGKKRSVCYDALDAKDGRFAGHLYYDRKTKLLSWIP
jgi:AAA domain